MNELVTIISRPSVLILAGDARYFHSDHTPSKSTKPSTPQYCVGSLGSLESPVRFVCGLVDIASIM